MEDCPQVLRDDRLILMAESFQRLTGKMLVAADGDIAQALWRAPAAIVAHGTQADPVFFFGNRRALELFEMTLEQFVALPSRLSAEAPLRDERARLLERVSRDGYIDDYSGIRVTAHGRRFRIQNAVVWNLLDAAGKLHGQAAMFADWDRLD
jgi:hypothetical protein